MRKKLMIICFFLISILALGKINDTLNMFGETEKITIENKIKEISDNKDIAIYVNSYMEDEGFVVEQAEKIVILNLIKTTNNKFKVELKLTKDMELEDVQDDIDNLLNINEQYLKEKSLSKYVLEILNGLNEVLTGVKIEEPIVVEEEIVEEKQSKFYIIMGIIFFIIFAMIIRILMVKYKKSFKEEIEIVSRKKY